MVDDMIYNKTKRESPITENHGRSSEKAEKIVLRYLSAALECLLKSSRAVQLQGKSLSEEDIEKLSVQVKHSAEIARKASLFHRSASALTEDIRKECKDDIRCAGFFRQVENFEIQIEKLNEQYLDSVNDLMEKIRNQMEKYKARLSGIAKMSEITRTGGDISFIQSSEMIDISV